MPTTCAACLWEEGQYPSKELGALLRGAAGRLRALETVAAGVHAYFYEPCNDGEKAAMLEARLKLALKAAGYSCADVENG